MRSLQNQALLLIDRLRPTEWQRTLVMAAVIGVLASAATIGFREGLFLIERLVFGRSDGLVRIAESLSWPARLAAPAVGGVIAGFLLAWSRRVSGQKPAGDYMEAIVLGDGDLPVRVSLIRALSSAASVASGGAIGREGPMVQLAALCGSLVGRWRRAPVPRRRLFVACAAAAGVATAYNAPIAGALFVAEIVLRSLAIESLGPLLVSAVAANLASSRLVGLEAVYHTSPFVLVPGEATLELALLGVVAGLTAPLYLKLLDVAHALFRRWSAPLPVKLGLGGLIVGAISVVAPQVWGNGYSVIQELIHGQWVWTLVVFVLVFKLLALAATTGSGAVGGIFTPTLLVGACAGSLFWAALQAVQPGTLPASASVAVGMGAFLAASTHAPLTSVLMIFEMTENYGVVVPSMLACVLAYFISRALRERSIYAAAGTLSNAPVLTMARDFLRTDSATVHALGTLESLQSAFLRYRWQHVYVLDEAGRFTGAISLHDLTAQLAAGARLDSPWPASLLRTDFHRVRDTTPAWQVMETFARHAGERLPVLDERDHLLGYITKTDLVLMFRERLSVS